MQNGVTNSDEGVFDEQELETKESFDLEDSGIKKLMQDNII